MREKLDDFRYWVADNGSYLFAAFMALALVGLVGWLIFRPTPPPVVDTTPIPITDSSAKTRLVVVDASFFVDAKDEKRTMMIVRDTATGREFLAVQGFGVTDMRTEYDAATKHSKSVED